MITSANSVEVGADAVTKEKQANNTLVIICSLEQMV